MLLTTRKKPLKKISELSFDLEIINPIESKNLFGGCHYTSCNNSCNAFGSDWNGGTLGTVTVGFNGSSGYGGNFGGHVLNGGYLSDWNNYGGNGGNSGSSSAPYVDPTPDPDQVISEYPDHICTQLNQSTTCATMALSYVANHFGGTGLTSSDFAEMAGKNYMSMLVGLEEGLNNIQFATIMSNVFQSTQISTNQEIASNANNGNPVLATINQGMGIGHEVVITNLNLVTGVITYMDSMTGGAVTSNHIANPITFIGSMYAVSGIQNNNIVNQYKNDTNDVKCGICGH